LAADGHVGLLPPEAEACGAWDVVSPRRGLTGAHPRYASGQRLSTYLGRRLGRYRLMADIGKPVREIEIRPLEEPVPAPAPDPVEEPEPALEPARTEH